MGDGTICDLNDRPRHTTVNYVCYPSGDKKSCKAYPGHERLALFQARMRCTRLRRVPPASMTSLSSLPSCASTRTTDRRSPTSTWSTAVHWMTGHRRSPKASSNWRTRAWCWGRTIKHLKESSCRETLQVRISACSGFKANICPRCNAMSLWRRVTEEIYWKKEPLGPTTFIFPQGACALRSSPS